MPPQKIVSKGVKRSFYEVNVPLTNTKVHLYSSDKESLNGRIIKLDLTRVLKGKSFELSYRVVYDPKSENLEGKPISIMLAQSFIRRMVRRGTDHVEDSFEAECKDSQTIVKPFMITRNKVSRAVRKELREQTKKYLLDYMKANSVQEVMSDMMANRLQKSLSLRLKKIYPLALCEIRIFEIVEGKSIIQD